MSWTLCSADLPSSQIFGHLPAAECQEAELESWGLQGYRGVSGVFWYVADVETSAFDRPAVLLGKIASAYELWADGERVGTVGALPPDGVVDYDRVLLARLPLRVGDRESVRIGLRVWGGPEQRAFGGGPFEGEFLVGEEADLARRNILQDLPRTLLAVLFLFAGLYHLGLSARGAGDRAFLWFGLLALDFASYTFLQTQWKYLTGLEFALLKDVEFLILYWGPVFGLEFFWSLVGRRIARWLRVYQVVVAVLGVAVFLEPGPAWNLATLDVFHGGLVLFAAATLWVLGREAGRGSLEARDLLVATAILFATVFNDVLLAKGMTPFGRLAPFGFGVLLLGMALALAAKVGRLQREAEGLRRDLQTRVKERTSELETLQEIVQAINRRFELEDVMRSVLEQGRRLVPQSDRAIFLYRDPLREVFEIVASTGWRESDFELSLPTDLAVRRYIEEAEEIESGVHLVSHPELASGAEAVAHLGETRSVLSLSIEIEGDLVGFLVFDDLVERDAFLRIDASTLARYREHVLSAVGKALSLRELVEKRQEAEQANRAKSDFLTTVSHELRSPLNSIIGFSGILLDRPLPEGDPRRTRFLENIRSSGRHLLSLINEILDLSKIEAGRMEARIEPVDVNEVIAGVSAVAGGVAAERSIHLETSLGARLPPVAADAGMLRQVLWNLVSNAIKFSSDGGRVEIRAGVDSGQVLLEVLDEGIGIAEEDRERIFRPFEQVESSTARRFSGTGLGLALVRQMLALQGGTVEVESEVDRGSMFRVRLPVAVEE